MCPHAKNIQDFQKRTSNIDHFILWMTIFLTHKDTDQSGVPAVGGLKFSMAQQKVQKNASWGTSASWGTKI